MGPLPPIPAPDLIFTLQEPSSGKSTALVDYFAKPKKIRTAGSFRVVEVAGLLSAPAEIKVYEYPAINFNTKGYEKQLKRLGNLDRYIAISHVWSRGFEVDKELGKMKMVERLHIETDGSNSGAKPPETISWLGLKQAANAAKDLPGSLPGGVKYFWLDFLCLDQVSRKKDKEKALQICIMGDIYKYAAGVVVMIGGVGAAQTVLGQTGWCDRAWTLQEAILNPKTWVLIQWPTLHRKVRKEGMTKGNWYFTQISGPGALFGMSLCLIHLLDLLDLADSQPLRKTALPSINVFDGMTKNGGDIHRRALRACLSPSKPIKYTGVWRSMFMRTSELPVDVVYSIMTIFGVRIDPYRKDRDPVFVFADLARKTAALGGIGPVWLTLGGVTGCAFTRYTESRVIPDFPHTSAAGISSTNNPPQMTVEGKTAWVGLHVDDSPWYVKRYDMYFVSHSHPHIINAFMFNVTVTKSLPPRKLKRVDFKAVVTRKYAQVKLGSMKGKCTYYGKLTPGKGQDIRAIYVGDIGSMNTGKPTVRIDFPDRYLKKYNFDGQKFILFMLYDRKSKLWDVVGDGAFRLDGGQTWTVPSTRQMIVIGTDSQNRIGRWPVHKTVKIPSNMDNRTRYFHNNYGVSELPEVGRSNYSQLDIDWIAIMVCISPKPLSPLSTDCVVNL